MDRKRENGGIDDNLDGFFNIAWHGAHTKFGGNGESPDIYTSIDIAADVVGGQFELYFCSTKCMRAFLNKIIDMLEEKMVKVAERI